MSTTSGMKTIPINKTFPDKNYKGKFCLSPYKSLSIDINGGAHLCMCETWGNQYIGNILTDKLETLLSNSAAQTIRQSILDGNYRYCNELACGVLKSNDLADFEMLNVQDQKLVSDPKTYEMPSDIFLSLDRTCNLSCPSCRTSVIKHSQDQIDTQLKIGEILYENLFSKPTDRTITLRLSSSGEIFASQMLLRFLRKLNLNDFPNLRLYIQTNGLLAPSKWQHIEHLEKNIDNITVTIDAAHSATYEKLRRGGKWNDILAAMKFLQTKKQILNFELATRLVAQLDNYKQLKDFYNFSKQFDTDLVEYVKLTNWNTFSKEEFAKLDVFDAGHSEYKDACEILNEVVKFSDVRVSGGL